MSLQKIGVIHGRFQILHNDHLKYLLAGKQCCEHLVVGITNPDPSLTKLDEADSTRSDKVANPFTYYERYLMVSAALIEAGLGQEDFSVVPFPINFPHLYRYYVPLDAVFYLTIYDQWGEKKLILFQDAGLQTEILWRRSCRDKGLTATEVRKRIVAGEEWQHLVPQTIVGLLQQWDVAARLQHLAK